MMKRAGALLAILSGKGKPGKGSPVEEDDEDMEDDAEDAGSAQDILDAIRDDDAEALHLALKKHYSECAEE